MKKIRICICDDISYLCEHFKFVFDAEEDMEVVGTAFNSSDCIKMVEEKKPDILLLDIQLETNDAGIQIASQLIQTNPDTKIIMLTIHEEENYILRLFALGINDYIIKTMSVDDIVSSIRNVYNSKQSLRPELAKIILNEVKRIESRQNSLLYTIDLLSKLSQSEFAVLKGLYDGISYADLAKARFVTEETIRSQVAHILKKFHMKKMNILIDQLRELNVFEIFKG